MPGKQSQGPNYRAQAVVPHKKLIPMEAEIILDQHGRRQKQREGTLQFIQFNPLVLEIRG